MVYTEDKEATATTAGPEDGRRLNYHTFPAATSTSFGPLARSTPTDDSTYCSDDPDDFDDSDGNYVCLQLCRNHCNHLCLRWCHRHLQKTMPPVHPLVVFLPLVLILLLLSLSLSSPVPVPWLAVLGKRQISAPPPNDSANASRPADIAEYDAETWTLGTHAMLPNTYQAQPYVANGYHGSRLTSEGVGYWRIRNESGSAWPVNGWPLDNPRQTVATIAGFWDSQRNTTRTNFPELLARGGESVVAGIPTWSALVVATADGAHAYAPGVDPAQVEAYHQTLSLRDGVVTTSLRWRPTPGGPAYELNYTVLAHRRRINVGLVRLDIRASADEQLLVTDLLDGAGAQRTEPAGTGVVVVEEEAAEAACGGAASGRLIWTGVHPAGLPNVTAYEFSALGADCDGTAEAVLAPSSISRARRRPWVSANTSTVAQEYAVRVRAGRTLTVLKYVGIASTDAFPDARAVARDAALGAKAAGWDALVAEHRAAWDALWADADVIIPGDDAHELQIAVRASLFHLLANVRAAHEGPGIGDNSVAVGGLSSDSYGGLVFWDADLWMLPGLLALHPDHAAAINNYRQRLLPQARRNARQHGLPGALFPWTSARFGNCTATGPCADYQYHLNTDIALVHWHQFLTTGDAGWLREKGWPVIEAVADMWAARVAVAPADGADGLRRGMFVVRNMTDPDEYANHVDNGAFTNAGIKVIMAVARDAAALVGAKPSARWADVERRIFIPFNADAGIVPEYARMNGSVEIKQADVVLLNYPLEFRLSEAQALNDLDFYARAQSPDGPAMTWAMFAIGALELSPHGCAAWTYFSYASQPYLREPYYQFSEQMVDDVATNGNTNPAFPFLTGHGGLLQIPTHGFTGYRPRPDAFYLDPALPPQLGPAGVTVKGMKHRGAAFTVHIGPSNTTITRHRHYCSRPGRVGGCGSGADARPVTVRIGPRNPRAGNYPLLPGDVLVVPTRRPDLNGTDIPGNRAECKRATSDSPFVPGQFPMAAVDGSNHTQWRPHSPRPAQLVIDLGRPTRFSTASLNWAKYPPLRFSLYASNSTNSPAGGSEQQDGKERGDDPGTAGWQPVLERHEVLVNAPWRPEDALKVRMQTGNTTVVELGRVVPAARYVMLRIEGDRSGEGVGGTVAQFALL